MAAAPGAIGMNLCASGNAAMERARKEHGGKYSAVFVLSVPILPSVE